METNFSVTNIPSPWHSPLAGIPPYFEGVPCPFGGVPAFFEGTPCPFVDRSSRRLS